jgi:hypothetical protein
MAQVSRIANPQVRAVQIRRTRAMMNDVMRKIRTAEAGGSV